MTKGTQVWALPSVGLGAGGTPSPSVPPGSKRHACLLCCLPSHGTQIFLFQLDVMSYSARLQPKFTFPHYCNCSAQCCNLKSAASDNKSTEVWNLLSHLLHCGIDALHITSGIWLLPCLSVPLFWFICLSCLPWKLGSKSTGEGKWSCAVFKVPF